MTLLRMENAAGACAEVLDYGARLRSMVVPDRDGKPGTCAWGLIPWRSTKRTATIWGAGGAVCQPDPGGRFRLGGREYALTVNQGANHLHGGARGFDRYVWEHRLEEKASSFSRTSPAGEEGYPGLLRVEAAYTLTEDNALCLRLTAEADEDTVVNLTGHAYWNLNGQGRGEVGSTPCPSTPLPLPNWRRTAVPTGPLPQWWVLPLICREPRALREGWDTTHPQIRLGGGYDHNWILRGDGLREAAVLRAPGERDLAASEHHAAGAPGLHRQRTERQAGASPARPMCRGGQWHWKGRAFQTPSTNRPSPPLCWRRARSISRRSCSHSAMTESDGRCPNEPL